MTDGMTKKDSKSRLLDFGISTKTYKYVNQFIVKVEV